MYERALPVSVHRYQVHTSYYNCVSSFLLLCLRFRSIYCKNPESFFWKLETWLGDQETSCWPGLASPELIQGPGVLRNRGEKKVVKRNSRKV